MTLPTPFNIGQRRTLSFDLVDLITGRSYSKILLGQANSTAILSFNAFDADPRFTQVTVGTVAIGTVANDTDYDFSVNRTFVIDGDVIGSLTIGAEWNSGNQYSFNWDMVLRKFSGSTETDIVTITSATNTVESGGNAEFADKISASGTAPTTIFKPGDKLRITLRIYLGTAGSGNATVMWAHDPRNGTAPGTNNTKFEALTMVNEVLLPFRVYE